MDILFNGDRMEEDKRCEVVGHESAMKNIHIDSNSKEGKLLIEVVDKESTLQRLEDEESSFFLCFNDKIYLR